MNQYKPEVSTRPGAVHTIIFRQLRTVSVPRQGSYGLGYDGDRIPFFQSLSRLRSRKDDFAIPFGCGLEKAGLSRPMIIEQEG